MTASVFKPAGLEPVMNFAISFPLRPNVARFERSGTERFNRTFHPCPLGQGDDEEVHDSL